MKVARVVKYDVDRILCWVALFNLLEHLLCRFGIDLLTFDEGRLECFKIKRTLNVEPLPA